MKTKKFCFEVLNLGPVILDQLALVTYLFPPHPTRPKQMKSTSTDPGAISEEISRTKNISN